MVNWELLVSKALTNLFCWDNFKEDDVFLVNIVKNSTNGNIPINKITNILIRSFLAKFNDRCNVISLEQLYVVYRKLEINPDNDSNCYEFAIKIANYLRANYILYGIVYGTQESPKLELQLVSEVSGEILFVSYDSIYD